MSWLWFLPALFFNSLMLYPLMAWSKRRSTGIPIGSKDLKLIFWEVVALIIWGTCLILGSSEKEDKKSLFKMVLVLVAIFGVYFTAQLAVKGKNKDRNAFLLKIIGILGVYFLNYFQIGSNPSSIYGFLSTTNYDLAFMS